MPNIFVISFVLLFLATLLCFGLGAAIVGRVERSAEVRVLLLLILFLGGAYLLSGAGDLLFGVLRSLGPRGYFVLNRISIVLLFGVAAFGGHFQALTLHRVFKTDKDIEVKFKPWAVFHIRQLHESARPISFWRNINHRFYIWTSYAMALLGITVYAIATRRTLIDYHDWAAAFPKSMTGHEGGLIGAAVGGLAGLHGPLQLYIVTAIYQRLPESARQVHPRFERIGGFFETVGKSMSVGIDCMPSKETYMRRSASLDEWKAFLALSVGTLMGGVLLVCKIVAGIQVKRGRLSWELAEAVDLALMLLPLAILLPLVYFKMRFVFFDVLIKRGLLVFGLLVLSGGWLFGLLLPVQRIATARTAIAGQIVGWAGLALFAALWIALHRRGAVALDRYLFRRPDYGRLLIEIANELRTRITDADAIEFVARRLREALGASAVAFVSAGAAPLDDELPESRGSLARIVVEAEDRLFGHLDCGARLRGQQYQSEDLQFLQTVAKELGRTLRQFELRDEYEHQARREQELRELAARSELKALRAQINPHFLFNALNIAVDLTEDDPKLAGETLIHLSHVFRYALDATRRESVRLGEELDFVRAYLEVERARFEEKLQFEITAPEDCRSVLIPPMLIQPLVENAIKHGIAPKIEGGCVRIDAGRENGRVRIRVADDGLGFDPAKRSTANGSGIGLSNVRERVARLYGEASWRLESSPGKGTTIEFELSADGRGDE